MRLQDLPPYLPKAFIAIEDRRFYSHFGIDPVGIVRAVANNLAGRGGMQGGSTLTQQLAKNLFLTQERTVSRKIQEAILALWLERKYSKDQILELYLNRVYFGSGAYGVDAAALKYFGHPAKDDTIPEAAMLAGLMKSPSKLAPNHYEKAAIERADQVIAAMAEQGHITEAQAKDALARPAHAVRGKDASTLNYAADYVMDVLDDTIGAIDEDIVVTSTINPAMQAQGERALIRRARARGRQIRRHPGGAGVAGFHRRHPRPDRRPQLRGKPVRPRGLRPPAARLVVQALRLSHRAGKGPHPRHGPRGRAHRRAWLAAGKRQPPLHGRGQPHHRRWRCRSTRWRCGSASKSARAP